MEKLIYSTLNEGRENAIMCRSLGEKIDNYYTTIDKNIIELQDIFDKNKEKIEEKNQCIEDAKIGMKNCKEEKIEIEASIMSNTDGLIKELNDFTRRSCDPDIIIKKNLFNKNIKKILPS